LLVGTNLLLVVEVPTTCCWVAFDVTISWYPVAWETRFQLKVGVLEEAAPLGARPVGALMDA
jgi:hypothetical protein